VPEKEFEETEHKAAALRRAIEDAVAPVGRRPSSKVEPGMEAEPEVETAP
jgi:hypothetical protein